MAAGHVCFSLSMLCLPLKIIHNSDIMVAYPELQPIS